MATFALVVSIAALLGSSSAQSNTDHVWSSVAYIFYGERTPIHGMNSFSPSLTPLGAQQMYAQGSMFRARYLEQGNFTEAQNRVTTHATIEGIEQIAIDNTQISVISTNDPYTSTGALAFMQGLYPPVPQAFADNAGGIAAAELANGSLVNYPLDGYQYPNMQILSTLDPNSVWIEGQATCTNYFESQLHFTDNPWVNTIYTQTLGFYQSMWEKIFIGTFPLTMASFYYAYDLFEYAAYRWNHDASVHDVMTSVDLAMLALYAGIQQRDLNGNLTVSGATQGDMIRAIGGRMLAGKIVERMKLNMASNGTTNKLNLMFGSYEPFIAFFALSGLVNGPNSANFQPLPNHGAAMIFELFSFGGNESVYPTTSNLWVRFLYRNSSVEGTPFIPYPLFGNGNSQAFMKFTDFASAMQAIAVDGIAAWCNVCDSINLFCSALDGNAGGSSDVPTTSGPKDGSINPVIAGVIGAVVTVAVVGLLLLAAMLLGIVRFSAAGKDGRNSTLGGFKGAEKMASDTDLAYAKSGGRHERTGSWELRNGGKAVQEDTATGGAGAVVQKSHARFDNKGVDDDAISVMGASPVKPMESV